MDSFALVCSLIFIINLISNAFHYPTHPRHFFFFFIHLVVFFYSFGCFGHFGHFCPTLFSSDSFIWENSRKEVDILYLLLLHVLVHLGTSRLMNMGQLMGSLQMILQRPGLDLQRPDFQFTRYKIIIKKTLNIHSFTVKILMGFYLQLKVLSWLQ